jgi:hypothetical protein
VNTDAPLTVAEQAVVRALVSAIVRELKAEKAGESRPPAVIAECGHRTHDNDDSDVVLICELPAGHEEPHGGTPRPKTIEPRWPEKIPWRHGRQ